jgi:hypothetical protein
MRTRAFRIFLAVYTSTIALLAALYALSWAAPRGWSWQTPRATYRVEMTPGRIGWIRWDLGADGRPEPRATAIIHEDGLFLETWTYLLSPIRQLASEAPHLSRAPRYEARVKLLSWLVVLGMIGAGDVIVGRWHRCRGHGPGFCRRCGYDLRATPARCPECGEVRNGE